MNLLRVCVEDSLRVSSSTMTAAAALTRVSMASESYLASSLSTTPHMDVTNDEPVLDSNTSLGVRGSRSPG